MRPALAIAWNGIRELLRKPSSYVFAAALLGLAFGLPGAVEGDGDSLGSRLRIAVTYGTGLPSALIALATLFLAAGAVSPDRERRQLEALASKPVRRAEIILGKLGGIIIIDAALLLAVLAAFAFNAHTLRERPGVPEEERGSAEDRFFTPHRAVAASAREIGADELRRRIEAILFDRGHSSDGGRSPAPDPARIEAEARRTLSVLRIEPGASAEVRFEGIDPARAASAGRVHIRYVLHASPPGRAVKIPCAWILPGPEGSPGAKVTAPPQGPGVPQEVAIPAALASGGSLRLRLENPGDSVTIIADPSRIEALLPHGTFWPNVFKAFALLLGRLILVASIGMLGSSLFGFATASLLGIFVYLSGTASSFLRETLEEPRVAGHAGFIEALARGMSVLGRAVLDLLPDFTRLDPLARVAGGRAILADELAGGLGWMLGVQAAAAIILAIFFFGRRELAGGGPA